MSKENPSKSQRKEILLYEESKASSISSKALVLLGLSEYSVILPFRIVKIVGEKRKRIASGMAGDSQVG